MTTDKNKTSGLFQGDQTMAVQAPRSASLVPGAARRATLVVLAGWEIGKEIELGDDEHLLGRSALASVRIDSPSVSREHVRILRVRDDHGEHFMLRDLGSSNGTLVNGVYTTETRLHNGDKVQMGEVLFKFALQDDVDARFYKDIHKLIHYDQLTGLLKMDAFRRELESEVAKGQPLVVAMTDLDGLKRVNDTHGHLAGRMVVREMGLMIRQALRPNDKAALYGGDETIILFPTTTVDEAAKVAEHLRHTVEARQFEHKGEGFHVSISQGLAEWPQHGRTIEEVVAAADKALYAAKAAGRNCVRIAGD